MFQVKKILKGYQPLCYLEDGVLLAKKKSLYKSDFQLGNIEKLVSLPKTIKERFFLSNRLLRRIFRMNFRCAVNVSNEFILLVTSDIIWKFCLKTQAFSIDFKIPNNRTALYLTVVPSQEGIVDDVIFGEYFSNPDKVPVNVWKRNSTDNKWIKKHTFTKGHINHVHNVIVDSQSNKLLILTGDFGESAAIWSSDFEFINCRMLYSGRQEYRACWAYIENDRINFAMDTQLESNYFCSIENDNLKKIERIEGSSIYFGISNNSVYFSSTVEPDEPSNNFIKDIFSYKLGNGILSNYVKIYKVVDGSIEVVFDAKKDWLPMRLGQFGAFTFPSGNYRNHGVIAYGIAVKSIDDSCILLE